MATDRELLKAQEAGALASSAATDPIGAVGEAHSALFEFTKSDADSMAADATSETYTGVYVPRKAKVKAIYFLPTSGGLTADATDYATITVSKRDSAADNKASLGTITTTVASSGNLTQGVAEAFVLTAANVVVAAGSTVTFEIAKAGSGVVVPAGRFILDLEFV